jgi:MinD-like ATPase involved in chromosome partitioning or flagellar assembly
VAVDPTYLTTAPPPPHRAQHASANAPTGEHPAVGAPIRADQMPRPESLLAPNRPRTSDQPAKWGWRGRLNRLSVGLIKPRPNAEELSDRVARIDIQRSFSKPMTVVVIQPKGGAGKTPTTIGLASALGVHRGGYVLGWDDNETRGTLAVRVKNLYGQSTTAWDLLGALPRFERPDARVGDLAHFVRAQGEAQFDALASDDNPANMAQIGEREFSRLHEVLQRFYRIIVIDTGNNVRSPNWQAAVNAADVVVVVSTYQRDVGYSASWVLDHLAQTGRHLLSTGAVTVLTAADPKPDPTVRQELISHFGTRTRSVVEIPYDPHIAVGGPMEWRLLKEATRRAWTRAGAAVVDALAASEGAIP